MLLNGLWLIIVDRMLAVMTMNVGYFFAVIVGYFIGDLLFGRFIKGESH